MREKARVIENQEEKIRTMKDARSSFNKTDVRIQYHSKHEEEEEQIPVEEQ